MRSVITSTLALCLSLFSSFVAAQAGSSPPVYFDTQGTHFYFGTTGQDEAEPESTQGQGLAPVYPAGVLQLPSSARYLLWAELEAGRLSVLENLGSQGLVLRKRIPISIGKEGMGKEVEGDRKTPLGVYRITSFLEDATLDDFYGLGAYPIDYPNVRDRLAGRTGYGIWLHGLPKSVTQRPLYDSDGCVVVDNDSLQELALEVEPGKTHLVISRRQINWLTQDQQEERRQGLQDALQGWRTAWQSRNNDAYLAFYSEDFSDLSRDKRGWSAYKRQVNDAKRYIDVDMQDISMLTTPDALDVVTVRFYQHYSSSNYQWQGWKEQLWRQEANGWKILYEGDG